MTPENSADVAIVAATPKSPNAKKLHAWYLKQRKKALDNELVNTSTGRLNLTELNKATGISYAQLKTKRPPNANMELQGLIELVNKALKISKLVINTNEGDAQGGTKQNPLKLDSTEKELILAKKQISRLETELAKAHALLQKQEKAHSSLSEYREVLAELGIHPE